MQKIADVIAFLFLSTLVSVTGLVIITVQAQTNSGTSFDSSTSITSNTNDTSGSSADSTTDTNRNTNDTANTGDSGSTTSTNDTATTDTTSTDTSPTPPPDSTTTNTNTAADTTTDTSSSADTTTNTNTTADTTTSPPPPVSDTTQPQNLGRYRVQSKNLSRSELVAVSLEANAVINVWTVRVTESTDIFIESTNTNRGKISDILIGDTIALYGTRNATAQSILAYVITVERPVVTNPTTTPAPEDEAPVDTDVVEDTPLDRPGVTEEDSTGDSSETAPEDAEPVPAPSAEEPVRSGGSSATVSDPIATQVQRVQQYCLDRGIIDTIQCETLIERSLDPICRASGVMSITGCQELLSEINLDRFCVNRDPEEFPLCRDYVVSTVESRLTCGSIPGDECLSIVRENLAGEVATKVARAERVKRVIVDKQFEYTNTKELITAVNENVDPEDELDTQEISSLHKDSDTSLVILPSEEVVDVSSSIIAEVTLPYISAIDTDRDGLPDDLERFYKTAVDDPDTDNDGYTDFEEIKNDYDPLLPEGEKVGRVFTPVELAILNRERVQQPIARGAVDQQLSANAIIANDTEDGYVISGTAEPSTRVLVYVYSRLPLVLTVEADQAGNWTYELDDQLSDGDHTVYVAITDEKGEIKKKSNPLSFLIQGAQAVTVGDLLNEQTLQQNQWVTDTSNETQFFIFYILGGIGVIIVGLVGVLLITRTRRQGNV